MNLTKPILLIIVALLGLAGPHRRVEATIINVPVSNFTFESPVLAGNPLYARGYSRTDIDGAAALPGWNFVSSGHSPSLGGVTPGIVSDPNINGTQVGYLVQGTMWQLTPARLEPSMTYQLSLVLGADTSTPEPATFALYSGTSFASSTLLTSRTVTVAFSPYQPVTLTFGPSDPTYAALVGAHSGENIIVALTGTTNPGVDFDNVQLLEIIPEPSTVLLFGVGGFLLFRLRRGFGGQGR